MSFVNPLFLIALVAVAIPVVVHLFSFRRYRKVYFSNVERIVEMRDETRRRSRLREWLLLVARIMTVVFLVMAFAQPVLHRGTPKPAGANAVSIYIDNSMSMRLNDSEGTLLQQAIDKARETAMGYGYADKFQLLTNEMDVVQFRWMNRDDLLLALDEVDISPVSVDLSQVVARQQAFLAQSGVANRYAYAIGDMQRSTTDIEQIVADSSIVLTLLPLAASAADNLYIDTLSFDAPAYQRGAMVTVRVVLRNSSSHKIEKAPVTLYAGGVQRAVAAVDLPADSRVETEMSFTADEEGVIDGYVETTDYPLTFDDRRYFAINIASEMQVAVVGKTNDYIAHLFDGDTLIGYRHVDERNLDLASLTTYSLIVVNEVQQLTSGVQQALREYVEAGGALAVVPCKGCDVASYNELLQSVRAPWLSSWDDGESRIADFNSEALLYRGVFGGRVPDDVELPTLHGYYRTATNENTIYTPLLTAVDGNIYMAATDYGAGHLYLVATALDAEHSDMVQQALFVPTLYNMAFYSRPQQQPYYTFGQQTIALPLDYDAQQGETHLTLEQPAVDVIPQITRGTSQAVMSLNGQMTTPGNYHLVNATGHVIGLAFNYSGDESLMQFYTPSELRELIDEHGLTGCEVVENVRRSMTDYVVRRSEGYALWRWCLWAALAMLAVEIALLKIVIKPRRKSQQEVMN